VGEREKVLQRSRASLALSRNDNAFGIRHGQVIGEFADVIKKKSTD
jgi:hypothetical protein